MVTLAHTDPGSNAIATEIRPIERPKLYADQ